MVNHFVHNLNKVTSDTGLQCNTQSTHFYYSLSLPLWNRNSYHALLSMSDQIIQVPP
jgi:hypothetical protein